MKRIAACLLVLALVLSLAACGSSGSAGSSDARIAVEGVSLSTTGTTLLPGQTFQLTANLRPSDASDKNLSWSTSNASVAVVDRNGLVTVLSAGSAVISVITSDGGFAATCSLTVQEAPVEGNQTGSTQPPAPAPVEATPDPFDAYYDQLIARVSANDERLALPEKAVTLREDERYDRYVQGGQGQGIKLIDGPGGTRIGTLDEGLKMTVLAEMQGYAFIHAEDGRYGWAIMERMVEKFDPELSHQRKVDYVIKDSTYWTKDGWWEWILANAEDFPDYVVEAARGAQH